MEEPLRLGRCPTGLFRADCAAMQWTSLEPWMADARGSLMASLAVGIAGDRRAVSAAQTHPWSNGQIEGQSTRVKPVKRQTQGYRTCLFAAWARTATK